MDEYEHRKIIFAHSFSCSVWLLQYFIYYVWIGRLETVILSMFFVRIVLEFRRWGQLRVPLVAINTKCTIFATGFFFGKLSCRARATNVAIFVGDSNQLEILFHNNSFRHTDVAYYQFVILEKNWCFFLNFSFKKLFLHIIDHYLVCSFALISDFSSFMRWGEWYQCMVLNLR